jgi:hypothetical protein
MLVGRLAELFAAGLAKLFAFHTGPVISPRSGFGSLLARALALVPVKWALAALLELRLPRACVRIADHRAAPGTRRGIVGETQLFRRIVVAFVRNATEGAVARD